MKRLFAFLSALAVTAACAVTAWAAQPIQVVEGIRVSGDYDWTRFAGQNVTLNVYNWGEYISNGSDGSIDVVDAFERLTGISVNYTTFDSNESMYAKLKSGAASYDVIIPSDYMVAKMIDEGMLLPLNFDNIPNFALIDEGYRNPDYDPPRLRPAERLQRPLYALHHRHHLQHHHGGPGPRRLGRPVGRAVRRQYPDVQQQPGRLRHCGLQGGQERQPPHHRRGGCTIRGTPSP